MKHILPILTAALALTATTAFAATTYTEAEFLDKEQNQYTKKYEYAYNVTPVDNVYDYGSYKVIRPTATKLKIYAVKDIDVYIYDFISDVQAPNNIDSIPLDEGTALKDRKVNLIGYRTYTGKTDDVVMNSDTDVAVEGSSGYKGEVHSLGTPTDSETIKRTYEGSDAVPYDIVRNTYYLGKFEAGNEYEIFLSAEGAPVADGVWSNTGYEANYQLSVDKLMAAYLNGDFGAFDEFNSKKYMPLVGLNGAAFGLYTVNANNTVFGHPLPGGVQIALIAGLFGLGFWYIRRRKSAVA